MFSVISRIHQCKKPQHSEICLSLMTAYLGIYVLLLELKATKNITRRSPKCSPHRTLLGPIGTHLSFNNREDGKVIFFFNVSNLQSFFNVQRTDGMPSVLSGSTKHFSCLPWFCCLSIYEDAQTCFVLCFYCSFLF